jgi:phage shock protein A
MESERQEFSTKTEEMSKIFQDKMSNKDENTDNSKQKMLESTLQNLRKELTQKNQTIEELIQKNKLLESQLNNKNAVYLKGSNLNERI